MERERERRKEQREGRIKQAFSAGYSRNRALFITGTRHSDANRGQFAFKKTYTIPDPLNHLGRLCNEAS